MSSLSSEQSAVIPCSENCARIKKLGYVAGRHMSLYGEHMELVSDPFDDGALVCARAISDTNDEVRTIELPVTILSGWEEVFLKAAKLHPSKPDSRTGAKKTSKPEKV